MTVFSEDDLKKIREAVQAAEQRTRGEIVPMVVQSSARYREASHLAGLALAFLVLAILLTIDVGWGQWVWTVHHPAWILLGVMVAYVLGSYIGSIPAGIRLFVSNQRMAFKVRIRAELAFYQHGLHRTREGTGVLIMLSLVERRAQVLADRGINDRVPPDTWDELVSELVEGIKHNRPTEALCQAITCSGDLLAQHFPAGPGDNPDELRNDLIQEK